ncbi:MAG: HEAT repeat domain-containing protein [Myxococcales bacterium]|nr:HEAT repeat domain-containing protein [Myxococcales bacterium]
MERSSLAPLSALIPAALALCLSAACGEREQLREAASKAERPEQRALALQKLAKDPTPNDYALFFQATRDPSATVREVAIEHLHLDDGPRIPDLLGALLDDPVPEVQTYAIKGLLHRLTPKKLAYLRNAYARKGTATRRLIGQSVDETLLADFVHAEAEMLWAQQQEKILPKNLFSDLSMARCREIPGCLALATQRQAIQHKDPIQDAPALVAKAALELGRSGRPEAVEQLTTLLGMPSIYVVAGAASGLGAAGDRATIPKLIDLLAEPYVPHVELREPTIAALVALDAAEAIAPLSEIAAKKEPAAEAALHALGRLSKSHPAPAKAALCKALDAASLEDARAVAEVLRRADIACDSTALVARLAQGGEAALAPLAVLEVLPSPDLATHVAALLDSSDLRVQSAAFRALSQLPGNPTLQARLPDLLARALDELHTAKQMWIPISRVREAWPEERYVNESDGHGHDHGDEQDTPPLTREQLRANGGISEEQIESMLKVQEASRSKGQKRKENFQAFLDRLDRLEMERAEVIGLQRPPKHVFAYEDDYIADLTDAQRDHLDALLTALARQRLPLLSAEDLERFWRMPEFRALACEVSASVGDRSSGSDDDKGAAPQLAKGASVATAAAKAADDGGDGDGFLGARCLRERDGDIQSAALRGFLRQGQAAIPLLIETLKVRTEQRAPIIDTLVALGAKDELLPLARAIVQEGGADGLSALQALAAFGDRESVPTIQAKLDEPALRERREVIEVLGKLGEPSVRDALVLELFSDQPEIRVAAIKALEELKLAGNVPQIAALKNDYFLEVRRLAEGSAAN